MEEDSWWVPALWVLMLPAAIFVAILVFILRGLRDEFAARQFVASLNASPLAGPLLAVIAVLGWATFAVFVYAFQVGVF